MTKIGLVLLCSLHRLHVRNLLAKDWRILKETRFLLKVQTWRHGYRKVLGLRFVFSIRGDFCSSQNSGKASQPFLQTVSNCSKGPFDSPKRCFFNQDLVVSWQFLMHFGTPESANVIRCGLIDMLFLSWKAGWCAVWMWRVVGWEDSCFHLFWQKHYWRVKEPTETVTVR